MNTRKILSILFLALVVMSALALYRENNPTTAPAEARHLMPIGTPVEIKAPLGLPPVPIPADNPPTAETIALGRRLYYDPILSADKTISCASCHGAADRLRRQQAILRRRRQKTWWTQLADGGECRVLRRAILGRPRP